MRSNMMQTPLCLNQPLEHAKCALFQPRSRVAPAGKFMKTRLRQDLKDWVSNTPA